MKPMGKNSTLFISYPDINVDEADLYGDAWGFDSEFSDVINLLGKIKSNPGEKLTVRLIDEIRKYY
jgi:hypothetical protein